MTEEGKPSMRPGSERSHKRRDDPPPQES